MNKKLTKLLSVFLIAGAIGTGVAGATGCKHKHSFDTKSWVTEEGASTHWHPAKCKHTDERGSEEAHKDEDKDGKCDVCKANMPGNSGDKTVTVTSVTVSAAGGATSLKVEETLQLTATVVATPDEAANKEVTWSSSDETKATVSQAGVVTGVAEGSVTITATSKKDKDKKDTITLTIAAKSTSGGEEDAVTITSVTVTAAGGATSVKTTETLQLEATVVATPDVAANKEVTWESSDDSKATVDENGLVTGVADGSVTITATSKKDANKKDTITLTVVAKSVYETLMGQSNKIYSNDFETAVDRLPDFGGEYGVKTGVYTDFAVNKNTAGATKDTHYVKVENGVATQVNPSAGTAYTVVDFGAIKGDAEGYVEVILSEVASGMTFVQFIGDSAAKVNNEVFGLRTDNGQVKYRLDGGSSLVGATPAIASAANMSVYFKYADGKLTVSVNGNALCTDLTGISKISGFRIASGDSNTRTVNADNLVLCGTLKSLDEVKASAKAELKEVYDGYDLDTEYETNKAHVTKAYEDGVKAIDGKDSVEGVTEAYDQAVAAMKAILKDSEIPAARSAAIAALETKFPYTKYSYTIAQDNPNSKYNNKATHESEMNAYKAQITSATLKSELDKIVADATISVGTDDEQLAKKQNDAVEELTAYAQTPEIVEAIAELNESDKARVNAILAETGEDSGIAAIKATVTIQGAQQEFDKAKNGIDRIIENSKLTIEQIIENYNKDLDDYVPTRAYNNTDKIDLNGTQTVVDLFNAAKSAGKTEIAKAKDKVAEGDNPTAAETLEAQKKFALAEYNKAIDAIELIAKKNFRLNNEDPEQGVRAYMSQARAKVSNDDLEALFDGVTETDIITAATTGKVILAVQQYKFEIDLIIKKNEACFGEGEADTPSTYGLDKYFNEKFEASGLREEDKEALYNKIYNAQYKAIYAIVAEDGDENEAVIAKVTKAAAEAKVVIDTEISALKNKVFNITANIVGYTDKSVTLHAKYGDKLTKYSLHVTGMKVVALYSADGTTPIESVDIYADTTICVALDDMTSEEFTSSAEYAPELVTEVTNITDTKVADNGLFSVTVPEGSAKYSKGVKNSQNKEFAEGNNNFTVNSTTYNNAINVGSVPFGENNSAKPVTIVAKAAMTLKVYVKFAGSNGTDSRGGNTFYTVNGKVTKVDGIDNVLTITVAAGDVVTVYMENTTEKKSGGNMWLAKVEGTVDTSAVPKLVTVVWQNEDGSVWKTTTHSYLDVIAQPEGSPVITSGALDGWEFADGTELTSTTKLVSSSTTYVLKPNIVVPDVIVNWTDGADKGEIKALSSAEESTKNMPAEKHADGTHLFLGWYVQANDAPADTDAEFDIKTATAGTYNVYAKYLESNLTITYKAKDDDTGVTVNLFKKADGTVVDKDGNPAALEEAPAATDPDKPEFKGWVYMKDETEVTLDLATVEAGNYTVVAKFGAMSVRVYSVDNSTLGTASNDVFTITGSLNSGSSKWTGTINGKDEEFTKAIRAGGDSGRSIKFHATAGTKISIACGGNYGTNGASGDIWIGSASNTVSTSALAIITATNDSGKKTASSLLEYIFETDGDYHIIFGSGKPSIYAIIFS